MLCPTEPQHLPRLLLVPSSDGEISVEALQELAKDAPHKNLAVAEDVVGDEEEKARENKYEEEHHTRPRDDDGIDSVMRERSISADSQPQRRQQQQQQQLQIRVVFKRRQIYNLSQGEEAQTGVNSSNNNINPTERETIQVSLKQLQDSNSLICTIEYSSRIGAFRALGSVMTRIWASSLSNNSTSSNNNLNFTETFSFKNNGVMIDCSRCAVLKLSTVKMLLRRMSLMGMNTLQLYTEDTYEISGEPMFGFLRGRYSLSELRVIDDYAHQFGIEAFPCIQTLGHLGQILQWPQYSHLRDTSEVLLANSQHTYVFIEKMIESISGAFRSRRIHIGMDESHGIGEGRYKSLFPDGKDCTEIFMDHLQRVYDICQRKGLEPLMWSDMLFTLAAKNSSLQSYYDQEGLPIRVQASIPESVSLVFWDYYHTNASVYEKKIAQHRELGREPWVAGGVWTWNRLFAALPFTFQASQACLDACKRNQIGNVFVTLWGDDGNEYDFVSALPGILYFAESGFSGADTSLDPATLKNRFAAVCGGNWDDWVAASAIDSVITHIPVDERTHFPPNMSKWLLWQDMTYSLFSPQCNDIHMGKFYYEIYQKCLAASENTLMYPLNHRLAFPTLIAQVLSIKTELRSHVSSILGSRNKCEMMKFTRGPLKQLRSAVDQLWRYHRDVVWLGTYKPHGLEIVEGRYGALRTRLESLHERLDCWCNNASGDDDDDNFQALSGLLEAVPVLYEGASASLVVDYARAYTPARCLGQG